MQNSWWHLSPSGDINNFHQLSTSFKKSVGNSVNHRFIIQKRPRMAQSGPEAAANTLLYFPNHTHLSSKGAHWKFSWLVLLKRFDCKHSSCFNDLIATFSVLNTLWDKLSKMGSKVFLQLGLIYTVEDQLSWKKGSFLIPCEWKMLILHFELFSTVRHLWFKVFCYNWNQFKKMRSSVLIQKRSDQAFLWQ